MNLEYLLKLRLTVARAGEMDALRWWNSQGVLGRHGGMLYSRGFARTHPVVRAKVAFSLARARCKEVFDPPASITLWSLPIAVEDEFDACWDLWLEEKEKWASFLESLEVHPGKSMFESLIALGQAPPDQVEAISKLRRTAEGRAVPLPGSHKLDDDLLTLLAGGFSHGEPGALAVPYLKLENLRT